MTFAAVAAVVTVTSVQAQGGDPFVKLSADRVDPGARLIVTATDLGGLQEYAVQLISSGPPVTLGVIQGNDRGDFTLTVLIPRDTPTGDYDIAVLASGEALYTVPLRVGPAATQPSDVGSTDSGAGDTSVPTDLGGPSGSLDLGATDDAFATASGTEPTALPDPGPIRGGLRDLLFVALVVGSLGVAAWGFAGRWGD